jgi:hypothetical protein
MKRWLAMVLVFAVSSAVLRADVTVVQTTTMEGGMAAMAGANMAPRMTDRIKGMKGRSDIEMPNVNASSIADLIAKQVIILRNDQKTAQIASGGATSAGAPVATATAKVDASVTTTGKSQVIDGVKCDEFTFTTTVTMAEITGGQMPPETAAMLKDFTLVVKGSTWVAKDAPGAAEYSAFQKALAGSGMAASSMKVAGLNIPGMDTMLRARAGVDGIPYMTVMDLTIEGGSGQMADMMKQMGTMRITTKVTAINADPLSDDLFKVPEGYTVIK